MAQRYTRIIRGIAQTRLGNPTLSQCIFELDLVTLDSKPYTKVRKRSERVASP